MCRALLVHIDHNRFEALSFGVSRLPQIAGDEELRRRAAGCGHMQNVKPVGVTWPGMIWAVADVKRIL